jgi:hypothetical protein
VCGGTSTAQCATQRFNPTAPFFREHSGNIQGTFREHLGTIQGIFREHSGTMQGTFREYSGNIQGTFRDHAGNIQGIFREHSGKRTFTGAVHHPNLCSSAEVIITFREHTGKI